MRLDDLAYAAIAGAALALAVTGSGCAGAARAPRSMPAVELPRPVAADPGPAAAAPPVHVVQAGETLWRISRRHGTTVDELMRLNGLDDPTALEVGRRLVLPGGTATATVAARLGWPVPGGRVLSPFGATRRTHRHRGVDIGGRHGDPVLAAAAGRVVYSGASMRGYGKTVIVDHGDGLSSLYAHSSKLLVDVGERVRRGQPIARLGRSGNATGDHCHFEVREHDRPVDPEIYLTRTAQARR